jgi:hypothetical protein
VGDANGSITANTVNAIHETSGPTQLSFGAISSGQYLSRSGTNIVGVAAPVTAVVGRLPNVLTGNSDPGYLVQLDFSTATSADLSVLGFIFRNVTDGLTMVRDGGLIPFASLIGGASPAAGHYRSTIKNGSLLLQLPATTGRDYFIYKTFTVPAVPTNNYGYASFVNGGHSASIAGVTGCQVTLMSGASPDLNNRVYSFMADVATFGHARTTAGANSTLSNTTMYSYAQTSTGCGFVMINKSAPNSHGFITSHTGYSRYFYDQTGEAVGLLTAGTTVAGGCSLFVNNDPTNQGWAWAIQSFGLWYGDLTVADTWMKD